MIGTCEVCGERVTLTEVQCGLLVSRRFVARCHDKVVCVDVDSEALERGNIRRLAFVRLGRAVA